MPSVTVGANVWSVLKGSILKDGSHGTDVYNAGPHTVKCLYNSSWVNIAVGSSLPPISNGSPTTYKVRRPDGGGGMHDILPRNKSEQGLSDGVVHSERLTKKEVRIDGYLRKRKPAIFSRRKEGVPLGILDPDNHLPPTVQPDPDAYLRNAAGNGDRCRLFDTGRDRNANGRTSVKGCIGLIFLLDGGRLSVGARRVA